jgi:glycosyltransferase involved in cell wall biosynthesis
MKVLLSAYACRPGEGSEPGVGWNFIKQAAKYHEVWVLTRKDNEKYIRRERIPNVHWIYISVPKVMIHLHYLLWQIKSYFVARRFHNKINFDLAQHVTYVNYWMPTFLPLLPIPFIWGPVGGADLTPKPFFKTFTLRNRIYENLRSITQFISRPLARITAKRSKIAIATTKETAKKLRELGCKKVIIQSQVAVGECGKQANSKSATFNLVSVGNLLHLKGFHLGLMAFAKLQEHFPESKYSIIGDGPERKRLEKLAKRNVYFLGRLHRNKVLQELRKSDVLLHPSLHDSGAFVCSEAMAAGLPVICFDIGGPAIQVTKDTGIKIKAINPNQTVNSLSKAILKLALEPNLRKKMGKAGKNRVEEHFNWNKKGELMNKIYQEVKSRYG